MLSLLMISKSYASEPVIPLACIGNGCAALSLAMVTSEYGIPTVLFSGPNKGGDLNVKTEVGNWPGIFFDFGKNIIPTLEKQAKRFGAETIHKTIVKVDFTSKPFKLTTQDQKTYLADHVVIATGTSTRYLTIPGAKSDKIIYNDDFFKDEHKVSKIVKNQEIAIIGNGIDAMKKAISSLRKGARRVNIYIRSHRFKIPPWRLAYLEKKSNIKIHYDYDLESVRENKDKLELSFKNGHTVTVGGVVAAIGRIPRSQMFEPVIKTDEKHRIIINKINFETNIDDVFAIGDVTDAAGPDPQAAIAAGDGMKAGYFLVEHFHEKNIPMQSNTNLSKSKNIESERPKVRPTFFSQPAFKLYADFFNVKR